MNIWNNYRSAKHTLTWNTSWKNDFRGNLLWTAERIRALNQTAIPFPSTHSIQLSWYINIGKIISETQTARTSPLPRCLPLPLHRRFWLPTVVLVERIIWVFLKPCKTKVWKRFEPMWVTWLPAWMSAHTVLHDRSAAEAATSAWQWPNASLLTLALWEIIRLYPPCRNSHWKDPKHVKFSLNAIISCLYRILNQFSTQYSAFKRGISRTQSLDLNQTNYSFMSYVYKI